MAISSEEPNAAAASADPECRCSCTSRRTAAAAVLLRSLRWTTIVLAVSNGLVLVGGALLAALALRRCGMREKGPVALAAAAAGARIGSMVRAGLAPTWILRHPADAASAREVRRKRRVWASPPAGGEDRSVEITKIHYMELGLGNVLAHVTYFGQHYALGSYLIQLLHCFLISSGVLRKDKILPLHRLRYLAVVIDSEEAKDTLKIKKLLRWLSNIGVKHVILYDFEGILKRSEASLRKWTCSSMGHCECDIHTLSPLVDQEKMTVEVVSSYDGKEAVVKAANFLCSRYLKENNVVGDQRELVFTEADIADALTTVGCGGPEPDFLLVFSPVRCHWGFPAWRMRYTEIVHMGSLKSMKYGAITKAIYDLSRKHQNFGS